MTKLLFLEDDKVLADTVIDFLDDEGFIVKHAKDGEEALTMSRLEDFDLYLFDVNVPKLNGFELLNKLRQENDNTPAFFITALIDITSMGEGFKAGADDYIKKPFDPEELILRIRMKLKASAENSTMHERVSTLESQLEEVTKESQEDFLTGVSNKRALEEKLKDYDASYVRFQRDYALFFIDIDFFKKINDTYGHDAGDSVLKEFANILKATSRDVDFIGRYGGEEFVMLLPEVSMDGAKLFAEKLRKTIESSEFAYKDNSLKLTMSGGICLRSELESNEALIKQADEYVYEAKRTGRNKILPNL